MDDFLNINVGGTMYTASRATLCRYPDSMLGSMFSDRLPSTRDEKGNYLIDGDGPLFRHVLNFLRRSVLVLPEDFKELDMLAQEADYYQINELIGAVNQVRRLRNKKEEAEKRQEFLELQFTPDGGRGHSWLIFGSWDVLHKIPVVNERFIYTWQQFNSELDGVFISSYVREVQPLNRIKLYEQITQLGFRLLSLSSRGADTNYNTHIVDRMIFARDAKTTSGRPTDP
ncbi:BTB/POZ domain-containing protein kctd15-like [Diadema setosum]|uniref:BTB/POZ domain-containing protein kctd15-like n=1 Tax=Diadema setosum TaxID=31175 RepID=UPI003B3BDD0B